MSGRGNRGKRIYLEGTEVSPERTAAEIQQRLVEAGARQVLTEYKDQEIVGLHFILSVDNQQLPFKMPVKTATIYRLLQARRHSTAAQYRDRDQAAAKRIAWRQLLRWVEIQIAMIETGMTAAAEVFMPYMEVSPGVTVYQRAIETHFGTLMLPSTTGDHLVTADLPDLRNK